MGDIDLECRVTEFCLIARNTRAAAASSAVCIATLHALQYMDSVAGLVP
jgi:hypothetical protein